jgi:hypothetical protein
LPSAPPPTGLAAVAGDGLDPMRAAFGPVGAACGACHDATRPSNDLSGAGRRNARPRQSHAPVPRLPPPRACRGWRVLRPDRARPMSHRRRSRGCRATPPPGKPCSGPGAARRATRCQEAEGEDRLILTGGDRWPAISAPSSRPTSPPIRPMASAAGRWRNSSPPCRTASRPRGGTTTRPSPIPPTGSPRGRTWRTSSPSSDIARLRHAVAAAPGRLPGDDHAGDRALEPSEPARRFHRRRRSDRGGDARPLPGRGARPLRRVPHAARRHGRAGPGALDDRGAEPLRSGHDPRAHPR